MMPQGHIPSSAPPAARETSEADVRIIGRVAVVIGFMLVALVAILFLFDRGLEVRYPSRTSEMPGRVTTAELPPKPRLQAHPLADLAAVRAEEDQHLYHYAWADRSQGIAQIPIDRAMTLWLKSTSVAPTAAPPRGILPASTKAASALPVAPVTELQMRRQKAQEGSRAP